jgi:hypothetical protein
MHIELSEFCNKICQNLLQNDAKFGSKTLTNSVVILLIMIKIQTNIGFKMIKIQTAKLVKYASFDNRVCITNINYSTWKIM